MAIGDIIVVGAGGGGFSNVEVKINSGAFDVTSLDKIKVEVWGGGGAGGEDGAAPSGGGGAGGYAMAILDVSGETSIACVVGAGGSVTNDGLDSSVTSGSDTVIGTGGIAGTTSSGGAGGIGSTGNAEDLDGRGETGNLISLSGGNAAGGGGCAGGQANVDASWPGGGGGGSITAGSAGEGAKGRVIIWY